jgi:hypothetical protein
VVAVHHNPVSVAVGSVGLQVLLQPVQLPSRDVRVVPLVVRLGGMRSSVVGLRQRGDETKKTKKRKQKKKRN